MRRKTWYARGPRIVSRAMFALSASSAEIADLSVIHRGHFGGRAVDNGHSRGLYKRSWRSTALRDGSSAKPLTVYAVNHPAVSYGHVGCTGFGGSAACRRRGRKVPGCLKSESEERETWTAESLRAASSNGEGLGLRVWAFPARVAAGRDFGGLTFQVNTVTIAKRKLREKSEWDLVKRCDQPRSILFNLRV